MDLNKKELKSIKLTDEIFNQIINTSLSNVGYIYLSSNLTLNNKQIEQLFIKNIDNVNINLLRNSKCPEKKINEFIALNDKIYHIAIAHNQNLSQENIDKLLNLNDSDVTMSLKFTHRL